MKKVLVVLVLIAGFINVNMAQTTVKIGHINLQELVPLMPAYNASLAELENYQKSLEVQGKTMYAELESKYAEYQANQTIWSEIVLETKGQAIEDLEKRLKDFEQRAQGKLQQKQQSLIDPIMKMATDAINAVAKANGYTYVFDTSSGTVLTYPDGDNILPLVKKHLGIL